MISTRGRYALRVMVDLAEHKNGGYVPMKEVSKRQDISLKYLERIMPLLTKAKLVEGMHGKGGGYRLLKDPEKCTVGSVLVAAGENLAPVSCLENDADPCERAAECRTLPMWQKFGEMVNGFFEGITVADLVKTEFVSDYVI